MPRRLRCLGLTATLAAFLSVGLVLFAGSWPPPIAAGTAEIAAEAEFAAPPTAKLSTSSVITWTQDSEAEWRQGTLIWLDGATSSGSLQLAHRLFGASTTITPREDLAAGQTDVAMATDANGNAYAVWRDGRNGHSDIYFAYHAASGTSWTPSVRVNDDTGIAEQSFPAIAVDGDGNAYAIWVDDRSGRQGIYFALRPAGGSWGANTQVSDDVSTASSVRFEPAIALDLGGSAYAVWTDSRNGNTDIYFSHRRADGRWSANERVNDDVGTTSQGMADIAVDAQGNAIAVWSDMRNGSGYEIYSACRPAGGRWSSNVRVGDDPQPIIQAQAAVAVDSEGNAHAVWYDLRNLSGDIYYSYRPAGGQWSANIPLDEELHPFQGAPDIGIDTDGTIYAVWQERENGEDIAFAYRAASSTSWSGKVRVNDDLGTALQMAPALAVSPAGDAWAIWGDYRDGNLDAYASHRLANGEWQPNVRVDDDVMGGASQENPSIATDPNGNAYALWTDRRSGTEDIYFAYRSPGDEWSANTRVNDDVGTAVQFARTNHAIAVDSGGNAYAIWTDDRNGDWEIYSAYRPSGGTWGPSLRVNNDDPGASQYNAAIAVSADGEAYAVWTDGRDGENGIYFAHRPTGGSWGPNVKLSAEPTVGQDGPDIAVDDEGNVYVAWQYDINGVADIYSTYLASGSAIWSAPVQVNDVADPGYQHSPSIAAGSGGSACVVWQSNPFLSGSGLSLQSACSPDGSSWESSGGLTDSETYVGFPVLAMGQDGGLHAAWADWRNLHQDIYYAHRPAGGEWGVNTRVNDDAGTGNQRSASIAVATNGAIEVAWLDASYAEYHVRSASSISTPQYVLTGSYTSPELDSGSAAATWQSLFWQGATPAGTSLFFETRSRSAGAGWSAWEPTAGAIASPAAQYLQYRASFATSLADATPRLDLAQITYDAVDTPSAPVFVTPCGVTNQAAPELVGSAAAGTTIRLYVDGSEAATALVGTDGAFAILPALSEGAHTLTATAEGAGGVGPASSPLNLKVDLALPYDPIRVRAGQWSKDGWLMSVPRDEFGCADPGNDWRIWPRADQALRVEVPVSYETTAAVTVTVGTASLSLSEENAGLFTGIFEPPIENGYFIIAVAADGVVTTITGGPVLIDPDGFVYEATGTPDDTIGGVQVRCDRWDAHSGHWVIWDAWTYDQINPQVTLDDGYYSFYTPPGTYRVVAAKEGYIEYSSPALVVVATPVRHNVPLSLISHNVYLPLTLRER